MNKTELTGLDCVIHENYYWFCKTRIITNLSWIFHKPLAAKPFFLDIHWEKIMDNYMVIGVKKKELTSSIKFPWIIQVRL